MDSTNPQVSLEVFPYLRVLKDGTIERLAGTAVFAAGLDHQTGVLSKDIVVLPEIGVSARLYRPKLIQNDRKLPLVIYYHGGAFVISSPADPIYHTSLNKLVAEAQIVLLAVDYRLAPEHPLPAAYDDSWSAVQWVASQFIGEKAQFKEPWIEEYADFKRLFLAGDSAGANIAHHMAFRIKESDLAGELTLTGILMMNPYFWGEKPIGIEVDDHFRREMVDNWWKFVCPRDKGNDDPLINPFVNEAPNLADLCCKRVIVTVAEKDILLERGKLYYENLVKSGWKGVAEMVETEGEDHDFHIFDPESEKAKSLVKRLGCFINGV